MADPALPPPPAADPFIEGLAQIIDNHFAKPLQGFGNDIRLLYQFSEIRYTGLQNAGLAGIASDAAMAQLDKVIAAFETAFLSKVLAPIQGGIALAKDFSKDAADLANQFEEFSGLSTDAVMRAEYGIDTIAQRAAVTSFDTIKNLSSMEVTLLDGTKRFIRNFEEPGVLFKNFTDAALRDARLYRAASLGMNEEMILSITTAQKRLGMTVEDTKELMQRELSATGQITGKFLDEQQKIILAASKLSGENVVKITKDLGRMMADFNTFGMMSQPALADLSVSLSKLGLDIQDVTSLAGKFSSFDTAIQTVNNLTAATGATLDTTRLFELANTDIQGFVTELRTNLEDQGVEFDNLNFIQKKAMASAFGIDPIILQRLLNDNIEAGESIAGSIADVAEKTSTEEKNKLLLSMGKIEAPNLADFTKQMANVENISLKTAQTLEKANSAIADTTVRGYRALMPEVNRLAERSQVILESVNKASEAIINTQNRYVPPPPPPPRATPAAVTPATPASVPAAPSTSAESVAPAPTAAAAPAPSAVQTAMTKSAESSKPVEIVISLTFNDAITKQFIRAEQLAKREFVYEGTRYTVETKTG